MYYLNRVFCISPGCKGDCNRKLTEAIRTGAKRMGVPIATAFFCGEAKVELKPKSSSVDRVWAYSKQPRYVDEKEVV